MFKNLGFGSELPPRIACNDGDGIGWLGGWMPLLLDAYDVAYDVNIKKGYVRLCQGYLVHCNMSI